MSKHITMASLGPIAESLARARERKGLSQRALGTRVGFPQSHISKIESATVDLQTTSLIEMARALDLEVALIPRSLIPALQALQEQALRSQPSRSPSRQGATAVQVPAYRLDDDNGEAS
jgi:transcriptional regulator with XRE-family HTH domain